MHICSFRSLACLLKDQILNIIFQFGVCNSRTSKMKAQLKLHSWELKFKNDINLKVTLKNCAEKPPINRMLCVGLETI